MSPAASNASDPIVVHDDALADHLYHLAQEAVNNAIKHGRPKNIIIGLAVVKGGGVLTIRDDGCGFDASRHEQVRPGDAHHELPRQNDRRIAGRANRHERRNRR